MIARLKRLFSKLRKEKPPEGFDWRTYVSSDLSYALAQALESEKKRAVLAQDEIKDFHPITQGILTELENTNAMGSEYGFFEPPEIRIAKVGKIIEKHIQCGIFEKKVQDIINE